MNEQLSSYVLVVEDDADILEMLGIVLSGTGYTPVVVRDGREALTRLRTGPRPRVVLLDMRMPGMDGRQFRKEQLDDPAIADVPVILMSGDTHIVETMVELGMTRYIRKPLDIDELLAAVRDAR